MSAGISSSSTALWHPQPFPYSVDDFSSDDRIYQDKVTGKYLLEEGEREYEWVESVQNWTETVDEALIAQQQTTYKFKDVDENEPAATSNKRKAPEEKSKSERQAPVNKSIFVSGLPLDAQKDEIYNYFKKCGLIENNVDDGEPKIRMYAGDSGNFKGEALITFYKASSVVEAVKRYDETDLREFSFEPGPLRVQAADMSYKKNKFSEATPEVKKTKKQHDIEKIKEMSKQMEKKLLDWDSDSETERYIPKKRWVTIKHAFTLDSLEEDPNAIKDIGEDMRDEAEKCGVVQDVTVYDLEPQGTVTVRFKHADSTAPFIKKIHGRSYDGRKLVAYVPDTKERYHRSNKWDLKPKPKPKQTAEDEEKRLESYGRELEAEGGEGVEAKGEKVNEPPGDDDKA